MIYKGLKVSIEECADEYACRFFRGKGRMIGKHLSETKFTPADWANNWLVPESYIFKEECCFQ